MAASAQQVAPMGSGLPAERSKGSTEVRRSPRAGLCSLGRLMGQEWPLSGARDLQGSGGRPVAASAQQAAPMGSGLPAERSNGSAKVRRSPRAGVVLSCRPHGVSIDNFCQKLPLTIIDNCHCCGQEVTCGRLCSTGRPDGVRNGR